MEHGAKMTRYLITTADERSWVYDRPVLFLGEWCCRYDRKSVWTKLDATIAAPYGVQREQKKNDFIYTNDLANQLLNELATSLNAFHRVSRSVRFWHIVLGPWLIRYVRMCFNRYSTIHQTIENHGISGTTIFDVPGYSLATNDTNDFSWACNDALWNHVLYGRILNDLKGVTVDSIMIQDSIGFCSELETNTSLGLRLYKKMILDLAVSHVLPKLSRKRDAFIINSYLPRLEEAKLAINLGQFPQVWRSPKLKKVLLDQKIRQDLKINTMGYHGFELFIREQIKDILPKCYVEGFDQMMEQISTLPWPASPKFIFTSNNFDTDEIFKVWTGCQVERGVPYFVGQHGNNYGTRCMNFPEMLTCDAFFSWGWKNQDTKTIPAFLFKKVKSNALRADPEGGLLLIETYRPHRFHTHDFDFCIYQEEQFKFVEALPLVIQQKLVVRLPVRSRKTFWSEEQQWRDRHPSVEVEPGIANIDKLINKSRLVIHSYDSTGMLETLAFNIPTICFWHGGFDHLLPTAKRFYEMLREVSIIVDTPEQAAEWVSKHWEQLDVWWGSSRLQRIRAIFCDEYARLDTRGAKSLKQMLCSATNVQNMEF